MQITIDLDLPAIIQSAVSAERIQPIVDKAISETIKDAINTATGYRSPFREALNKQLSEAMPHGLRIDDMAKFQLMLNRAISNVVEHGNAQAIQAAMESITKHVMPDVPARIKLSELIDAARDGFHKEKHEAFYAHLEMSDYGSGWLYLDDDEDCRDKYRADMCLAFNKDGDVYSLKLDGRNLTPKILPNAIGRFDGLLLSMYVGRTSLELDMDSDDVEDAAQAQED
jgi:hypothetical protein